MEAMNPTKLKNLLSTPKENTAVREYALSSSADRNDEKIRLKFGNYSQHNP
jgi:hypothetical protein